MSFSSELLIKVLAVLALAPGMALGLTILDVKGASWMQRRPGPLHVGLRGFIFPLATAAKYLQKETIIPNDVDEPVFCLLYTSPSPRDLSTSRMPSSA